MTGFRFRRWLWLLCLLLAGIPAGLAQDEPAGDLLTRADEAAQNADYAGALVLYDAYLRLEPASAAALAERALVQARAGDFDAAFANAEAALDAAGFSAHQQAVAHSSRAQIHFLNGSHWLALRDFSRAIQLHPRFADYWMNRGILRQMMGYREAALADYRQVIALQPDDIEARLSIARLHLMRGELDATLQALSAAIDRAPQDAELYILRGSVNLTAENDAAAAQDYAAWLDLINLESIEREPLAGSPSRLRLPMTYGHLHRIPFAAQKGQRLGLVANSAQVDSLVVLLDPAGLPIAADDDSALGLNALILDFTLPADGSYTLLVGHARGGWEGEIALTVQIAPAASGG